MTRTPGRAPIWELINEHETTTAATAARLREQITTLSEQLTAAESELADLATTRATLTRLTGGPEPAVTAADPTIASNAYQQILTVLTAASEPLRAKDVARELNASLAPKDVEGIRAKLKRLVNRNILTEPEPGLFTLTPTRETGDQQP